MNTMTSGLPLLTVYRPSHQSRYPRVAGSTGETRGPQESTPAPTSSCLNLAAEAAREVRLGNRADLSGLLFLGASAAVVLAGAAMRLERFVSGWSSFESFVRALLG